MLMDSSAMYGGSVEEYGERVDRYTRVLTEDPVYRLLSKSMPDSSEVCVPGGTKGRLRKIPRSRVAKGFPNANTVKTGLRQWGQRVKERGKEFSNSTTGGVVWGVGGGAGGLAGVQYVNRKRLRAGLAEPDFAGRAPATHGYLPEKSPYWQPPPAGLMKSFDGEMVIAKTDTDKRQVFGWASITHRNGRPVVDRQGDYIALEEVEKSAYDYVVKSRVGGRQHRRTDDGAAFHAADLIESMVMTPEKAEAMGAGTDGTMGWWVGFKVNDDESWADVKSGKATAFSIHGKGKRADFDGVFQPEATVDGS
jgi:hypothetical protein